MERPSLYAVLIISGMLFFGSLGTIAKKAQFQEVSIGIDGKPEVFAKPWFSTALMFLGEFTCLAVLPLARRWSAGQDDDAEAASGVVGLLAEEHDGMDDADTLERGSGDLAAGDAAADESTLLLDAPPVSSHGVQSGPAAVLNTKPVPGAKVAEIQRRRNDRLRQRVAEQRRREFDAKYQDGRQVAAPTRRWIWPLLFLGTACCDLVGTTLAGIGLIYTTASAWQMLRGSLVIFTGATSVVVFKRRLPKYEWLGIVIVVGGLVLVGSSSLLDTGDGSSSGSGGISTHAVLLGELLIVAGQLANAFQFAVEELYVKKMNFHPLAIVGMEGLFGFVMMCGIVLPVLYFIPGSDNGSYENTLDSLVMLTHNGWLVLFSVLYVISIPFYNALGIAISKEFTAVHRTIVDAVRITLVWSVELFLYYRVTHSLGSPWSVYSWLQLGGFVVLSLGTAIHGAALRLACFKYPDGKGE